MNYKKSVMFLSYGGATFFCAVALLYAIFDNGKIFLLSGILSSFSLVFLFFGILTDARRKKRIIFLLPLILVDLYFFVTDILLVLAAIFVWSISGFAP